MWLLSYQLVQMLQCFKKCKIRNSATRPCYDWLDGCWDTNSQWWVV